MGLEYLVRKFLFGCVHACIGELRHIFEMLCTEGFRLCWLHAALILRLHAALILSSIKIIVLETCTRQ